MLNKVDSNLLIKPRLINRALAYWIPILVIALTFRNFIWFLDSFSFIESIKITIFVTGYVIFFEYRIYGYKIELASDYIIYQQRGFPLFRKQKIFRKDISKHQPVYFGSSGKVRSAYYELQLDHEKVFVNIANFRPNDVKTFEHWLEGGF